MISDTLSEAVEDIDEYLRVLPDVYEGEIRGRIIILRDQMEAMRIELDAPPPVPEDSERLVYVPAARSPGHVQSWHDPVTDEYWIKIRGSWKLLGPEDHA